MWENANKHSDLIQKWTMLSNDMLYNVITAKKKIKKQATQPTNQIKTHIEAVDINIVVQK